jgi:5-methylcytosine-specific restriction endonuclease McrA
MNRKFTVKQRRYLYLLAGGKCEECGSDLIREFHSDHKQAFSKGGETALHNGQALCPQCNLKKGNQ